MTSTPGVVVVLGAAGVGALDALPLDLGGHPLADGGRETFLGDLDRGLPGGALTGGELLAAGRAPGFPGGLGRLLGGLREVLGPLRGALLHHRGLQPGAARGVLDRHGSGERGEAGVGGCGLGLRRRARRPSEPGRAVPVHGGTGGDRYRRRPGRSARHWRAEREPRSVARWWSARPNRRRRARGRRWRGQPDRGTASHGARLAAMPPDSLPSLSTTAGWRCWRSERSRRRVRTRVRIVRPCRGA